MGVLTQLKPNALEPVAIAKVPVAIDKGAVQHTAEKQTKCSKCLNSSFWEPIGNATAICLVCNPPITPKLVKRIFFFDDWGNLWVIEKNQDGSESYVRETFEPGSPGCVRETQIEMQ